MGKSTKKKQELWQARQPDYSGILLKAKETQVKKTADLMAFDPMNVIRGYEQFAIRKLDSFTPRTRSLNTVTRGKELIRYAFNKYNPPDFLYSAWENELTKYNYLFGISEDFRQWYLALAQGRSLYKECTMGLLTKQETHHFSTCPFQLSIPEAVWYSVIRCMDEKKPQAFARKLASTKLSAHKIDDFWKGVVRWFMLNETSVRQTNDLLDYINSRHQENHDWYLKDQTLTGMQKAMHSWHREMYRMRSMSGKFTHWKGIDVSDKEIERVQKKVVTIWKFHQITTGRELAEEGNRQHHCVSSYGSRCNNGDCSIWSLTQRDPFSSATRALTIEVNREGDIVQARGYANRSARADESNVLREWAAKCGFRVRGSL